MLKKAYGFAGPVLMLIAGCSGGGGAQDEIAGPAESQAAVGQGDMGDTPLAGPELLNELKVDETEINFYQVMIPGPDGDESSIMMTQTGRIDSVDPVNSLIEQNGPLTALEIFTAYAAPTQTPHPALVASQRVEAKALGRSDVDQVFKAVLDKTVAGNPAASNCLSYTFPDVTPFFWTQKNTLAASNLANEMLCAGDPFEQHEGFNLGPSTRCINKTRDWVSVATCNDGSITNGCTAPINGQVAYGPSTDGDWAATAPFNLPSGVYKRYTWGPSTSKQPKKALAAFGFPLSTSSNPCTVFHLVSGVAVQ